MYRITQYAVIDLKSPQKLGFFYAVLNRLTIFCCLIYSVRTSACRDYFAMRDLAPDLNSILGGATTTGAV